MTIKTVKGDAAVYLDTEALLAAYLNNALASGDSAEISQALGTAARAKGMAVIAKRASLGRQSLYKALSPEGNPSFDTVLRVFEALGIELSVQAPPLRRPQVLQRRPFSKRVKRSRARR